ncbi:hypothetical protein M7784_06340 [Desulfovibrio aminophilus]|nr:hypothetical protein [Desulfovibrio aminophilus]MCM0754863.1 hypothetical protein [Desulfovibrio aminophilus]
MGLSAGFFEGMLHLLFQNAIHSFWKKTRDPQHNTPESGRRHGLPENGKHFVHAHRQAKTQM